ncbi:N-acetylmuramoyl-L-alanine amidase [Brevibacillus sp. SYSU BS000544]|uniref:N-acetylmuramoyl-L-alanine amidase n=1 Tax=Brevibacillus sp. SYSU BS000544 TaxID=3416443 RepID=UPI003CE4858C
MNIKAIQENKWYKMLLELATEDYIHVNQFSRDGRSLNSQSFTVWHYTADPGATDENERNYFESLKNQNPNDSVNDRYAGAHIFIHRHDARIIIPLWERAYHSGDSWYNLNAIGIELCIEKDGSFHPETIATAIKVGALLQLLFGYRTDRNIRHYDVTGKICPKPWVDNPSLFSKFKKDLETQLQIYVNPPVSKPVNTVNSQTVVKLEIDAKPTEITGFLKDGKAYLPVRKLADALGKSDAIGWCETSRMVLLSGYVLNSSVLINGTGYAWVREIANVMGMDVDWFEETKTVKLKGKVKL